MAGSPGQPEAGGSRKTSLAPQDLDREGRKAGSHERPTKGHEGPTKGHEGPTKGHEGRTKGHEGPTKGQGRQAGR